MQKKLLMRGPLLSRSGYGEQSRFALRALKSHRDLFDVYIINTPWGSTKNIAESSPERVEIEFLLQKTHQFMQQGGQFDASLQITVPNQFERITPVNIGYTAGIETTKVAPEWIGKVNETMERVIVVSNHAKTVFENTVYQAKNEETGEVINDWRVKVPIDVVNYCVRGTEAPEALDIEFTTSKNFLVMSQWAPRKNVEKTLQWFVETFKDDEDVGLVLKTNTAADCIIDREFTTHRINHVLNNMGVSDRKCKIYFLHGELTPNHLSWLYLHPTMQALINIGHGEGWGLPLFEAACNGLPLLTITWSGQMDFICKPNKKGKDVPRVIKVDYDLADIQPHARVPQMLVEGSQWAYAKEASYKRALRETIDKQGHYRNEAKALQKYVLDRFTPEKMYKQFADSVLEACGGVSAPAVDDNTVLEF